MKLVALSVLALAGAAHGQVLFEDFEGGVPPAGWSYADYEAGGSAHAWTVNTATGEGNYTNGSGLAAMSDSDSNPGEYNHALITPAISLLNGPSSLSYTSNYQNFALLDFANTDISTDGGATWTTLLSWNSDMGTFYGTPGVDVVLDISAYAGQTVHIRFHHYNPNASDWDWYWQVDNVRVDSVPAPASAVLLGLGAVLAGRRRRA